MEQEELEELIQFLQKPSNNYISIKKRNSIIKGLKQGKELVENLTHSKRIFNAIHATREDLKKSFPKSFMYIAPKQIISADTLYLKEYKNITYLALSDSTGHGIPGAFFSILENNFLKEIIEYKKIYQPNKILEALDQIVWNEILKPSIKNNQHGEGSFQLHLMALNRSKGILSGASSREKAVLMPKNTKDIVILNSDRFEIGNYKADKEKHVFRGSNIKIDEGDKILLYTDGYVDQFGGKNKRKFMTRKFHDLVKNTRDFSVEEQGNVIISEFKNWKRNETQIDDVSLVIFEYQNKNVANTIQIYDEPAKDILTQMKKQKEHFEITSRLEPEIKIKKEDMWPGIIHNSLNGREKIKSIPSYETQFKNTIRLHKEVEKIENYEDQKKFIKTNGLEGYIFYDKEEGNLKPYRIRDSDGNYKRKGKQFIYRKRKPFHQSPKNKERYVTKRMYNQNDEIRNKYKSAFAFYKDMKK